MKQKKVELHRQAYQFPPGTSNWREVEPDPPGVWAGIYGKMENQQIINREKAGSAGLVMGRSLYQAGAYHEPHCYFHAEGVHLLLERQVRGMEPRQGVPFPGDPQFAKPGEIHWLRNPFDEPVELAWAYSGAAMPSESGYATVDIFEQQMALYKKNQTPK